MTEDDVRLDDLLKRVESLERSQELKLWRISQVEAMEERLQGRLERLDQGLKAGIEESNLKVDRQFKEFAEVQERRLEAQDRIIKQEREAFDKSLNEHTNRVDNALSAFASTGRTIQLTVLIAMITVAGAVMGAVLTSLLK